MLRARLQTVEETRKIKRPRGRAPNGFCWDEQKAGWYDENGFEFVKVDHPARKEESKRSADARAVSALPLSLLFLLTSIQYDCRHLRFLVGQPVMVGCPFPAGLFLLHFHSLCLLRFVVGMPVEMHPFPSRTRTAGRFGLLSHALFLL